MASRKESKSKPAVRADLQVRAYELGLLALSYREIAKRMTAEGTPVSHTLVQKLITKECAERVHPLSDEWRKQQMDRLNVMMSKIMEQIHEPRFAGSLARNVEVAVKVAERQARLIGADKPTVVEANVNVTENTEADRAIQDLISSLQAKAALEQQTEVATESV